MTLDEIGPWSEIKLDIIRHYAAPYSRILKSNGFQHGYIDAFSGPGRHIRKAGGEKVLGSLVENARRKARLKRGGGQERLELEQLDLAETLPDEKVLLINDALERFEKVDAQKARVVVLKFFGGGSRTNVLVRPKSVGALAHPCGAAGRTGR